jgi:hypothetical protein
MNYYSFLVTAKWYGGGPHTYTFAGWYPSFVKTHQAWKLKETLDLSPTDNVSLLHVKRSKRLPVAAIREITDTAKCNSDVEKILAKFDMEDAKL